MKNSAESALFIVINGKIFSISDMLDSFIQSPESYVKMATKNKDDTGLVRGTYVAINKWYGPRDIKNKSKAEQRSREIYSEVLARLAATKLKMSLNMVDFKNMAQRNIL